MSWDDDDFYSADPLVRFNAHQAAKGNSPLPDPDHVRKAERESARPQAADPVVYVCENPEADWIAGLGERTPSAPDGKENRAD